ncbi:MAG TPA: DUF115 domain-containing protein [Anaerolineaceae bacterium]|nr:DUF115 domain-containing protein [Anaerolineaceae bacterium]HPN53348.1 DUF115 domain-containing protein [Anaerolineaceae bacterium]
MDRQKYKRYVPRPLWKLGSDAYWWWHNRGRHETARIFSGEWSQNVARLRAYKDIHAGKRCFLIGNGPSLRQTDMSLIKNEYSIGLNRLYMAFEELGFSTTYLVSVNDLVLEQCAADFSALKMPCFFSWRARRWLKASPTLHFLDTDYTGPENFSGDATGRLFEGFTVTYVGMQLAFYMGFTEVILIGVDHNFTTKGPANTTVTSQGDDPNHFSPGYFGKGFRWQLPDLEGSERAYILAREAYAKAGRRIVDATVGGKLTIYPKVDYLGLFNKAK